MPFGDTNVKKQLENEMNKREKIRVVFQIISWEIIQQFKFNSNGSEQASEYAQLYYQDINMEYCTCT